MTETTPDPAWGWSGWERDLWTHLTDHIESERGLLDEYMAIAKSTDSKALHYLVGLLVDDEIRHHRIFMELADALKTLANVGDDPAIPYMDFDQVNGGDVLAATKDLLKKERQDERELERLRREFHDVKDTTLWGLLVDLMRHDTQKHIALLKFVEEHAHARRG